MAEPSEEGLVEQLEAQLRELRVGDLLVQTLYTVSSLGYARLAAEGRDLEQARLAIEALRALVPVLAGAVPAEVARDFNQVTANLQLAYVQALGEGGSKPAPEVTPEEGADAEG